MDLKIWLRYQLSGSVYIAWFLIFYYSSNSYDLADVASKIFALDVLKIFAAGIPIGAIIHQFSVSLKNQVLGGWFGLRFFQDSMYDDSILTNAIINSMMCNSVMQRGDVPPNLQNELPIFDCNCSKNEDNANCNGQINAEIIDSKITATHEKLSALNTFYYMRVDNGFFAPVLAFISYLLVAASSYEDLPIFTFYTVMCLISITTLLRIMGWVNRKIKNKAIKNNTKDNTKDLYVCVFVLPIVFGCGIPLLIFCFSWLFLLVAVVACAVFILILYGKTKICNKIRQMNLIVFISKICNKIRQMNLIVFISKICNKIRQMSSIIFILLLLIYCLCQLDKIFDSTEYELNYSRYLNHANKIHVVQINEQHTYESMNNKVVLLSDNGNPLSYESKEIYEYDSSESIVNIMGKNMVDISSLQPQQTDVSSVTYLSNGKKYEVTKVNGELLPCVIAFCLVYMIALLSYIPIIYFERRDTWNHYVKS